jgi:predicted ferric reductase
MNKHIKSLVYILAYCLLISLPVIVFFSFDMPEKRSFLRDVSVMLGFFGLSMAGMQFIPTTRLSFLSDVFDMDRVYKVHHILSILSAVLIIFHPVILIVNNPNTLLLLNPFTAPWRAQAGLIGLVGFLMIALTSIYRKEVKLGYDTWHTIHTFLALFIMVFGLIHIFKVNYYSAAISMRIAWIIEIGIWSIFILYLRIIKPILIKKHPYTIDQVIEEIPNTWTLVLKPEGHAGLKFKAAQVAWINIDTSPFIIHRNPFSISGSAENREELRFTIKALGDFTNTIGTLRGGETVYVDGPYGNFNLEDENTKNGLVLIAGGIGVAPIMSILRTLSEQHDKRPVFFFYGNYNDENIIFKDEIDKLMKTLNLSVTHILEKPSKKIKCETGYITREILEKNLPNQKENLHIFMCGPLPMIKATNKNLALLGIHPRQITAEQYEMA